MTDPITTATNTRLREMDSGAFLRRCRQKMSSDTE